MNIIDKITHKDIIKMHEEKIRKDFLIHDIDDVSLNILEIESHGKYTIWRIQVNNVYSIDCWMWGNKKPSYYICKNYGNLENNKTFPMKSLKECLFKLQEEISNGK